jgi:hypothetical protein
LSAREVERLAVLRVVLLASDPQAVKVEVWPADALMLLARWIGWRSGRSRRCRRTSR